MKRGVSRVVVLVFLTVAAGVVITWKLQRRQAAKLEPAGSVGALDNIEVPASAAEVVIPIEGMTTDSSVTAVEGALSGLSGVYRATVGRAERSVVVEYDPVRTSPPEMIGAIERAGCIPGVPVAR
jgi:copper chaperone CopZ